MVGAIIIILMLGGVVWFVGAPIRAARSGVDEEPDAGRAALEAAKEAKYREIRDTEMDHRTGKLSPEDYRRLDRSLRAEAIDLLRQLDDLGPEPAARPPRRASV